jgi:hypothetical protein
LGESAIKIKHLRKTMSSARRFRHLTRRRRKGPITSGFSFSRPVAPPKSQLFSGPEDTVVAAPTPQRGIRKVKQKQTRRPAAAGNPNQTAEKACKPRWAPGIGDPSHWTIDASTEAVNGAELLDLIAVEFEQYVVLPLHAMVALTLWVVHTYVIDAGDISPILAVTSPTKRCGKTTLLKLLAWLAFRTVFVSNISASSIFRYVDAKQPTLLIDEGDTFLIGNDQMRGTLNAGHARGGAYVMRTRGNSVVRFSTWAAKAIALIGALPATLADRSICVSMQRRKDSEQRARIAIATARTSKPCEAMRFDGRMTISRHWWIRIPRSLPRSMIVRRITGALLLP